jgi:hypothetical protein
MAGTAVTVAAPGRIPDSNAELIALREEHNKVITDLATLRTAISEFSASTTWDPGSIGDGNEEAKEITVTGAALGDFVTACSFNKDTTDLILDAQVTAANTVTAVLANESGGGVDLASGTLRVRTSSPGIANVAGDLTAATINA